MTVTVTINVSNDDRADDVTDAINDTLNDLALNGIIDDRNDDAWKVERSAGS